MPEKVMINEIPNSTSAELHEAILVPFAIVGHFLRQGNLLLLSLGLGTFVLVYYQYPEKVR